MYKFASPMHQRHLPTMYELPSEEIGEPGLPDEFHRMQAERDYQALLKKLQDKGVDLDML